jgi:heterodisulfide reductase subunit A
VELVEQSDQLGGNLLWLGQTIEGTPFEPYLQEIVPAVEAHRLIHIHRQTTVSASFGEVGDFYTTLESAEGDIQTVQHGIAILATGGKEAPAQAFGYGDSPAVITQKDLETRLKQGQLDAHQLSNVVMIQCVGSRQEPRNYCSRVCCPTSLKHALMLKQANPDLAVYILYRDMMTLGFAESYFTAARKAGVIFIQYQPNDPPQVSIPPEPDTAVWVTAKDPILSRMLEIKTDLLVLATGIVPSLPKDLADAFGVKVDQDGFFQEAESKWRPVDALKEGVFGCGIALSPRSVPEAVATATAAAQRSLRILANDQVSAGKVVSSVRHSLCSLCEQCVDVCPYNARRLDSDLDKILVNAAMCQGCGECTTACPNSASVLKGFTDFQMLDMIDAAMESTWQRRSPMAPGNS